MCCGFTKQVTAAIILGIIILISTQIPHFSIIVIAIILAGFGYEALTEASPVPTGNQPAVDEPLANLHNFLYLKQQYLHSQQWKTKRQKAIARDRYRCTSCGSSNSLQVHHRSHYLSIPNEPLLALVTLCNDCHQSLHNRIGYPQSYQDYKDWSH